MTDHRPTPNPDTTAVANLIDCARQAEDAMRQLARLTHHAPALTPAEVDTVLSHLLETVAALPQVTSQLSSTLDRSRETYLLAMDDMTATTDPDLALDTARLHLDEARHPALATYRRLDAARKEVAHIRAAPAPLDDYLTEHPTLSERRHRPQDRRPPASGHVHGPGNGGPRR